MFERIQVPRLFLSLTAALSCVSLTHCLTTSHGCEDVLADPEVRFFDVKLAKTAVPDQLTTYVCQTQSIPLEHNQAYHAVAFEPLIHNQEVMHHMLMFGCGETYMTDGQLAASRTPHMCGAADNTCRSFLVQWSMGLDGRICSPPGTGVRFGFKSFTSLALQIHWNNEELRADMTDSSGFRIYYTTRLKKYDLGNVQVGQNDLEIPPGQGRYTQTGSCSSECTSQWLQQPIFLTRAHIHMHYIGDGGVLKLVRDGEVIQVIVRDDTYDYGNPPVHVFGHPAQVMPGDELRLSCFFNTRDGEKMRNQTVYWGEGSDGEMCYAFITYYPMINDFNQCIQFEDYDVCTETGFAPFGDCVFQGFVHTFESGMGREILAHCTSASAGDRSSQEDDSLLCSAACLDAVREVTDHPCMQGRLGKYARRVYLPEVETWADVSRVIGEHEARCHE